MSKTMGVGIREALHDISYVNAIMFSAAMPMYGDKAQKDNRPVYDDAKDANRVGAFSMDTDEEIVRS